MGNHACRTVCFPTKLLSGPLLYLLMMTAFSIMTNFKLKLSKNSCK